MNTDLLINLLAAAIVLTVLGLAGYIAYAIRASDLPASDEPIVDVDEQGDATEVLPAVQASADAQVGTVDHVGADGEWAAELHRAAMASRIELPIVQRTLRHDWRDLIAEASSYQLQPTDAYIGRHSEDSIEMRIVPTGWTPPIGRARIHAAIDGTQQIDRVQA